MTDARKLADLIESWNRRGILSEGFSKSALVAEIVTALTGTRYVSLRPAAWLHKEHGNAYVITDRIKQLWIDAGNPGHVENYTIPLYTGSDISGGST